MNKNLIILFLFMGVLASCQNKENKSTKTMKNNKLIDNITLDNSIFKIEDIDIHKYYYNGILIENIYINDLLDEEYRKEFIKYLLTIKNEDDNFKSTLITQLLIIRMIQLSDSDSFYILSEISKNKNIAYNGIELYQDTLFKFFIMKPDFFVKEGSKYKDSTIFKNISNLFGEYIADEDFFRSNMASVDIENKQLLLFPEKEKEFNDSFKKVLKNLPKSEAIFSPSLYTAWKNETIYFTNIYPILGKQLTNNFSIDEKLYFKFNVLPVLKKYTKIGYFIQDPDGYTNLRKEKNISSEILEKINVEEEIIVLDSTDNWWLVQSQSGNMGYVYKTKIKEE